MSHSLISVAVLLIFVAAASAIFHPPFPLMGPRPIMPFVGPGPLLPILPRPGPLLPMVPIVHPPMLPRLKKRFKRKRVQEQVVSRPKTRPFTIPSVNVRQFERNNLGRRDDRVTVNLIDGRDTAGPNVYLVDYGRDGFFDNGMDFIGPGLGLGLGDDRFGRGGDISIDGNVYVGGNPGGGIGPGAALDAAIGGAIGGPVAAGLAGGIGGTDVYDFALPPLPIDGGNIGLGPVPGPIGLNNVPGNLALNTVPQGPAVPLI